MGVLDTHGKDHVRKPTLYDVAKAAGVSHQTVSRVVKGATNVNREMKEAVEAAIVALDYRPNLLARSLANKRSNRIAAIVHDLHEVGPSTIIKGAGERAREAGLMLDVVGVDSSDEKALREAVRMVSTQELAGVFVIASTLAIQQVVDETTFRVPVYVGSTDDVLEDGLSASPNYVGTQLALDHLWGLGHRKYFTVAGPSSWQSAAARLTALESQLLVRGEVLLGIGEGDWTARSGYRAASEIPLDSATAVVVANDQMAIGVLRWLSERGVRVPQDLSVVGFDNIPESEFFNPPLTTVQLDLAQVGRVVVDRLRAMISAEPLGALANVVAPELMVRSSTSAPKMA